MDSERIRIYASPDKLTFHYVNLATGRGLRALDIKETNKSLEKTEPTKEIEKIPEPLKEGNPIVDKSLREM